MSLGKRTLKHVDYGKMAATFVDTTSGAAAREDARERTAAWAPREFDRRRAQIAAYRVMPERWLLDVQRVSIVPGWLDRRRVRVACAACGEGVNYEREVRAGATVLCRACAGDRYYVPEPPRGT